MRRLGIALLALLALAAGAASAGYWYWLRPDEPRWPIVIQQADGNLALADARGQIKPLTSDADGRTRTYTQPTPAPDGRSVAAVSVQQSSTERNSALVVVDLEGRPTTLFEQTGSEPFYLAWSPDSARLAFLASGTGTFTLHAAEADGQTRAQAIAPGQPLYFSWSPDSTQLLLHVGGSGYDGGTLQLYTWGDDRPKTLGTQPGGFQAPAWLPDGQQALTVVLEPSGAGLVRIDRAGNVQQRVADAGESVVFVAAPDATRVAYLKPSGDDAGRLHVVRADGSDDRALDIERVVTCFWSPDSARLALLSVTTDGLQTTALRQQAPRLRWHVLTLADNTIQSFDPFQPSLEFLSLLPFFDQYAQSHRVWDRAGQRLLYAAADGVYTLDVRTGAAARIAPGVLGLWME